MKSTFYVLMICFLAATTMGCHDEKAKTESVSAKQFSIEGAKEQVVTSYENGVHKLSIYTDEKTDAKIAEVEFHKNGQPKINKHFENDSLNGESWCYYEDAKPWSLNTFKNGVNEGPYKTWHENGKLYIDGNYVNGKEEGEWLIYYDNGVLNTKGFYNNGEKVGLWLSYNREGIIKREQDFSKKEP